MHIDTRGQKTRTKLQLPIVSVFQPCRKKKANTHHELMLMFVSFQVRNSHIYHCRKQFYIQTSFYIQQGKRRCCDTTIHLAWWAFRCFSVKTTHPPEVQTTKPQNLHKSICIYFPIHQIGLRGKTPAA